VTLQTIDPGTGEMLALHAELGTTLVAGGSSPGVNMNWVIGSVPVLLTVTR
jgi:hypothetical protein